jgi:hypothetical protein
MHINYDSDEENAENFQVSERSFRLCFPSFQFLRENYKQEDKKFVSSIMGKISYESIEDSIHDMEVVLAPKL